MLQKSLILGAMLFPAATSPYQCSAPLFLACSASCKCLVAAAAKAVALSFWKSAATACTEGNDNTYLYRLLKVVLFSKRPSRCYIYYLLLLLFWLHLNVEHISYQQQILCSNPHCIGKSIIIFILHELLWICGPNFYLKQKGDKKDRVVD